MYFTKHVNINFLRSMSIKIQKDTRIFSRFNCIDKTFSNLHSLTLTYINDDIWCLLRTRLPSFLVMLSIHLVHIGQRADSLITSAILTEIVFFSPSLKRLSIKMSNYSDRMVMILPQPLHLQ